MWRSTNEAALRTGYVVLNSYKGAISCTQCHPLAGFLSTAGSRTAGLIVPFKTPTRLFHNSPWAMRELETKPQRGEQVYERMKYIFWKNIRNPMTAVGIAWAIGFPSGIVLFFLTKRQVEKNHLKQLKIRQRMKASNEGEYLSRRYKFATQRTVEVDEAKT